MLTAYLNGQFLPLSETKVSAMDRGFLFGDGVYEVIPVYAGKLFRIDQHLSRLRHSLEAISLAITQSNNDIQKILEELLQHNPPAKEQGIYLQITRGPTPERDFFFSEKISPTLFAYCFAANISDYGTLSKGFKVITVTDIRWQRCDVKAITLLANILMREQAKAAGANDAIVINQQEAIEGAASNLFIVIKGQIITPPLSTKILGGVTRDLVLELATNHHVPFKEAYILKQELYTADEIWLTSSTKEIWPIIECDGRKIGEGKPGPLWHRMIQYYQDYKFSLIQT